MKEGFGLIVCCRFWCLSEVLVVLSGLRVEDNTCVEIGLLWIALTWNWSEFQKLLLCIECCEWVVVERVCPQLLTRIAAEVGVGLRVMALTFGRTSKSVISLPLLCWVRGRAKGDWVEQSVWVIDYSRVVVNDLCFLLFEWCLSCVQTMTRMAALTFGGQWRGCWNLWKAFQTCGSCDVWTVEGLGCVDWVVVVCALSWGLLDFSWRAALMTACLDVWLKGSCLLCSGCCLWSVSAVCVN